jgi:tetratricopeptide (TPR) repeat protein
VSQRRPSSLPQFFEALRAAESRLPSGLVRLGGPASETDLLSAETRLGRSIPRALRDLLRSFDGADLFHESVILYGVGPEALRSLVEGNAGAAPRKLHVEELIIGETTNGELFALEPEDDEVKDEPRVFRLHPDAEERWLVGSSLGAFLESTLAHQQLLYGPDGEFLLEAFEEGGEELTPTFALRRAERAIKKDPQASIYHHEAGLALRRMGKHEEARAAFARAAALDPANPWPWFDLGRSERTLGQLAEAGAAFECAAEATTGGARGRFFAWSARCFFEAGEADTAARVLEEARRGHPALAEELRRAATAAAESGADEDPSEPEAETRQDAEALATLVETGRPPALRLPVVSSTPAPPAARPARRPAAPARKRNGKAKPKPKARPATSRVRPRAKPSKPTKRRAPKR